MLATALTTTLLGLDAHLVRVEVESYRGPSGFELVGLAEASVRESRVRVRSALHQLGVLLDEYRVVVNLAPGDVRKAGSSFDLAIAMATLAAIGRLPPGALDGTLLLGELSLAGGLGHVPGLLPQLLFARSSGIVRAVIPRGNGAEASPVRNLRSLVADSLSEVLDALSGKTALDEASSPAPRQRLESTVDLSEVRGQHLAKRALEIAAAGHHHLLMVGPPGGGKTMLARRLPSIMPPLGEEEALEATTVYSAAGLLPAGEGLLLDRPFRAPHHTATDAGLVGGGYPPRPGEISLAHHGVLFLDELPEFRRSALEALRQPLEDGLLVVARARTRSTFPARPLLIAASNPCPCGYLRDGTSRCACSQERVRSYAARLSGPIVDRLDLHVPLPSVPVASLAGAATGERSALVRERVVAARARQSKRQQQGLVRASCNGALGPSDIEAVALPDVEGQRLLTGAIERLGLSARAYVKVLRLARTIADLAGDPHVRVQHIAEAVQFRRFERGPSSSGASLDSRVPSSS